MFRPVALLAVLILALGSVAHAEELVFGQPETAGLAGFRVLWDEVIPLSETGKIEYTDPKITTAMPSAVWGTVARKGEPGALAFDALQRSLLVRFPGAAEGIAAKLNAGYTITKVELALPYRDVELWPPHGKDFWDKQNGGYTARRNWGVDEMYRNYIPNWHALAWAVRKPWSMETPELGPTYNANIKGASYWEQFGAQGNADQVDVQFGPAEVSKRKPDGRMDITASVTDPAFGATLGERLRRLSDCGFVVKKWETYDHHYFNGVYEWATATGGRGVLINTPQLIVTVEKAVKPEKVTLPQAADITKLAEALKDGKGGKPTAVMPTEEEILALDKKLSAKPAWMADWQWARVQELEGLQKALPEPLFFDLLLDRHTIYNIAGTFDRSKGGQQPGTPVDRYSAWVDGLLARQPRGWAGFAAGREMTQWYRFNEALPGPAKEAIKAYWIAWLMPDRETAQPESARRDPKSTDGKLIHPMADQLWGNQGGGRGGTEKYVNDTYVALTDDWRGNKSFYRSGFCWTVSTQNFNTTSSSGALLGGAMIDAKLPQADGRHGVLSFPMGYTWNDGSGQEHIDHYYYSVTLSGNKAIRDFGPTWFDRLVGESLMAGGMEELIGAWHPGMKRYLATSGRTALHHLLGTQDGVYHIMHTMARGGALLDPNQPQNLPKGMPMLGHELSPLLVANQTKEYPWAPEWAANMVDKPLPFLATHKAGSHWRRAYLGEHYGLATINTQQPRIQIMGHWRREEAPVDQVQDFVTMNLRFGFNQTKFANDAAGWIAYQASSPVLHHNNKLLVVASPYKLWGNADGVGFPGSGDKVTVNSLQTSIALFNYEATPSWKIYIDGKPVEQLPATATYGQVITIHDGVSYCGVVPLPSPNLGQRAQVVLEEGTTQKFDNVDLKPALVIHSYVFNREAPLVVGDIPAVDAAYGGFAVEMGDVKEYGSFAKFQQHMQAAKVQMQFDNAANTVQATYASGKDVLAMTRATVAEKETDGQYACTMTVNGQNPYPAGGIDRDTPYTQSGRGGRLEKGGAVLTSADTNAKLFLQAEPVSGNIVAWNPRQWPVPLELTLPNGAKVATDGKAPLMRLTANLKTQTLAVDYAWYLDQATKPDAAKAVTVTGWKELKSVTVNGQPVKMQGGVIPMPNNWEE